MKIYSLNTVIIIEINTEPTLGKGDYVRTITNWTENEKIKTKKYTWKKTVDNHLLHSMFTFENPI